MNRSQEILQLYTSVDELSEGRKKKHINSKKKKSEVLSNSTDLDNDSYEESDNIDWDRVKEAGISTAKKIHKKPDHKILDSMIEKIKKHEHVKDTEDAIQVIVHMLRSKV